MMTIDEIKEKTSRVFDDYPIGAVMLFGSYATGTQTEDSDVDLLVKNSDLGILEMSRMHIEITASVWPPTCAKAK